MLALPELCTVNSGRARHLITAVITIALLLCATTETSARKLHSKNETQAQPSTPVVEPESALVKTLVEIRNNRLDSALLEVNKVLASYPNFRLAHLIKGDLLLSRSRPLKELGEAPNAPREPVEDLREEARARLARYQRERPTDRVPKFLLKLNAEQKHALIVDTRQSTLYVFENRNGEPHYLADYYVTIGKNGVDKHKEGDKRTPLGVYHVTSNLPRAKLADLYGSGAYPISYPNEIDKREGRGGKGIWLHGTPSATYSRPPRSSDGCVALTNQDLDVLGKSLQIGITPVIISEGIEWVKPEAVTALRKELLAEVEAWRKDWASLNTDAYLKHYAPGFTSGSQSLDEWKQQKRSVNASKAWIKVALENVSVFLYPGRDDLAVVAFEQNYSSSNLSNQMRKRQYWLREKADWRIIYEGSA
jgi:murein L,D-transpeptidase YafK